MLKRHYEHHNLLSEIFSFLSSHFFKAMTPLTVKLWPNNNLTENLRRVYRDSTKEFESSTKARRLFLSTET